MEAIVTNNQSLLDVAIQHSGSAEAAFDTALQNGISLTDDLDTGETLELPTAANRDIRQYYAVGGHRPATAVTVSDKEEASAAGEGIDFWAIGFDFVIGGGRGIEFDIVEDDFEVI